MINWAFKNPSVKITNPPGRKFSPRIQLLMENKADFGLEGEYEIFTGEVKPDNKDVWEDDDQGTTFRRLDYTMDPNNTSRRIVTETPIPNLDNWPYKNPHYYGRIKTEADFSNTYDPHQAWINYLANTPVEVISIEDLEEYIDPESNTDIFAEDYINWLQELSNQDGYKIINIDRQDFFIDGEREQEEGTYTSSSGYNGEWRTDGLRWNISIKTDRWRQVKL